MHAASRGNGAHLAPRNYTHPSKRKVYRAASSWHGSHRRGYRPVSGAHALGLHVACAHGTSHKARLFASMHTGTYLRACGSMCTRPAYRFQLMLCEYRRQESLRRLRGKFQGRLPRCALKVADGALHSYGWCVPYTAPERMPTCMTTPRMLHIHRLGVLSAAPWKPHL